MSISLRTAQKFFTLLVVCMLACPAYLFAATDQFLVTQSVVAPDTEPPTTPVNLVATPLSPSQIDLDWDASSDNISVAGYQVFRDGMQIATSVVSNYSDSGLLPATSYDYTVTAFDGALNISTSSATTTALTTATPTTLPSQGGGPPLYPIPLLTNFKIAVTEFGAQLSWDTSLPVRSTVSWGLTADYEISSLSGNTLISHHATELPDLVPGTTYKFRILGRDSAGNETLLKEDSFTTIALPDTEAPPNVSMFRGWIEGSDAVLAWKNPTVADFNHVRIVRKEGGYPRDPSDGVIVYEGDATAFRDRNAFAQDGVHFYGLFAYDRNGNDSSGAIVRLEKREGVVVTEPIVGPTIDMGTTTGLAPLSLRDIIVEQDGNDITFVGERIPLQGDRPFTLKIPYGRLPEHLKTILITFTHPTDHTLTFSFILRVNDEKTFYSATIDALGDSGLYGLSLALLDYQEQTIVHLYGALDVAAVPTPHERQNVTFFGYLQNMFVQINPWLPILFFLLILLIILMMHRRKEKVREVSFVPIK